MKFWTDFYRACKTVIVPMVLLFVATIIVFFTVSHDAAWLLSYIGTPLILLGNVIYIWSSHA